MNRPSMRLGFSIASVRPRPGSRSSARAPVPKWTSRSSSAVERRDFPEQPRQRGGDGRRADAAADADDGGHDVRAVSLRFPARTRQDHLRMRERVAQLIDRERLQQIIVNAAGDEVAIEADVVDGAGRDHDRARFADFRQRVDVVERIRGFAEVHEQNVRACRHR